MPRYRKSATVRALQISTTLEAALRDLQDLVGIDLSSSLEITSDLGYRKWGGDQSASVGDFLVLNPAAGNDLYTCEKTVMLSTYEEVTPNEFLKTASIEAREATSSGEIRTLEGFSKFQPGDFIVTNPGGDQYVISARNFHEMYDPLEPSV